MVPILVYNAWPHKKPDAAEARRNRSGESAVEGNLTIHTLPWWDSFRPLDTASASLSYFLCPLTRTEKLFVKADSGTVGSSSVETN